MPASREGGREREKQKKDRKPVLLNITLGTVGIYWYPYFFFLLMLNLISADGGSVLATRPVLA